MRLNKEEYKEAVGCLKRYNYNCIKIINIRNDYMSLSSAVSDGMPKAPYSISDTVFNQVIQMEEDKELQRSIKEYKAVSQALQLVEEDSRHIFEDLYIKCKLKWDIIECRNLSERTYERRKKELIYTTFTELKKIGGNLAEF